MLSLLLIFMLIVAIVIDHACRLRRHRWISSFKGPSLNLPIIGDAWRLVGSSSTVPDKMRRNFEKYGSTWGMWLLTKPSMMTIDPKFAHKILNSTDHLQRHFMYDHTVKLITGQYGLSSSDVRQWKSDRKIWNKIFNPEYFEDSLEINVNQWNLTKKYLLEYEGQFVQCSMLFRKHFLATLIKSFDIEDNLTTEEAIEPIVAKFNDSFDLLNKTISKPWITTPVLWKPFGSMKLENFHQTFKEYIKLIFLRWKKADETSELRGKNEEAKASRISAKSILTDDTKPWQWKYDHFITILLAGADTSAITARMTLFYLAANRDCLKKVQSEVDYYFENKVGESLKLSDLSNLKYLRMCIKEALRLHPTVPVIGRTTSTDIVLDDGRRIPKGTSVAIFIHQLHLNPDYFPNPLKFDPERFHKDNEKSFKHGGYIPFSLGPRNCIGQKYSGVVLTSFLALILRNFEIRSSQNPEDIKVLYEASGTPNPEVEIMFELKKEKSKC